MPTVPLPPAELRLTIDPATLGFADTAELADEALPWIGQARAEAAARFGLGMDQPNYNLFVLGEVGSGRSSLLRQAMVEAAANRKVPPDLCYLHNFDTPARPLALRLPAGEGRLLRQLLTQAVKNLQADIPLQLGGQDYKTESERIEKAWKDDVARHYAEVAAVAEARSFSLHREAGRRVFTLIGKKGQARTEDEVLALPKARRVAVEQAEQELRAEIARYVEKTQPLERAMIEALAALRRQVVKPLVERELQAIRAGLKKQIKDAAKLNAWLDALERDLFDNLELFNSGEDEEGRQEELRAVLARYRVNLVVDNDGLTGAPVIVEDNPLFRALFGSIEYQSENDVLMTDFSRIRAGSLLRAHGGFLMLHLRDVLADPLVWEKLRRFLRSGRLQIEEPGVSFSPIAAVSLVPEADVEMALAAQAARHDYPEQRLREEIAEGDVLIDLTGERLGQVNGLTQIDLGDYRFGLPVRLSARVHAGEDGLLNIEREVELSGPIHDKGVFILQSYLAALFAHLAPLSLTASLAFEQQYHEVEGDSASCAALYALLSALSGLPLKP